MAPFTSPALSAQWNHPRSSWLCACTCWHVCGGGWADPWAGPSKIPVAWLLGDIATGRLMAWNITFMFHPVWDIDKWSHVCSNRLSPRSRNGKRIINSQDFATSMVSEMSTGDLNTFDIIWLFWTFVPSWAFYKQSVSLNIIIAKVHTPELMACGREGHVVFPCWT